MLDLHLKTDGSQQPPVDTALTTCNPKRFLWQGEAAEPSIHCLT